MVREGDIMMASRPLHDSSDHGTFEPLTIGDGDANVILWDHDVVLELYKDGELADVVIEAGDLSNGSRRVSKEVHSFVLALASPVLRRMIIWEKERKISSSRDGQKGDKDRSRLVLEFAEEDYRVVGALCDFIYMGKTTVSGGAQELVALCKLADQLDVQRLRTAVVEAARASLSVSTCATMLQACRHAGVPELEEACMQFALKHFEEVAQTAAFLDLDALFLSNLLADDRLQAASEAVVYEALLLWMTGGRPGRRLSALSLLEASDEAGEGEVGAGLEGGRGSWHVGRLEGEELPPCGDLQGSSSAASSSGSSETEEWEGEAAGGNLLDCIRFGLLQDEYLQARVMDDARQWGCGELEQKALEAQQMEWGVREAISCRSGSGPDAARVQRYTVRHVTKEHAGSVEALALYGHGVVVSGSRDGSIRMFDVLEGRSLGPLVRPPRSVEVGGLELELGSVYALLVRGERLFCGSQLRGIGPLNVLDLRTGQHKGRLEGHTEAVMSLVAKADSLYSGSWDTTIREWSLQRMECLRVIPHVNAKPVVSMFCCKDAFVVSSGTMGSTEVHAVWHQTHPPAHSHALDPAMVSHTACLAVGIGPGPGSDSSSGIFRPAARVFTGHKDGYIRVWETGTWRCVAAIHAHKDCVTALEAWGACLVSGSVDCSVRIWDLSCANLSGVDECAGIAMGCRALCSKVVYVQSEVASLVVCDGKIVIGSKDRSMRVIDADSD